ncbi:sensor domain-containing diguanylate cyclase [Halanaerobium praevalens]|uniref:sensor domain-containing diguanylate cyclase n=1 Tax=Halanaerobium praevalens TaxID=2331 RepID=UPI0002FBB6C0|nr:sensor domain-containing diguanylate cyclase [Halanaerobium praevalens]
MREAELPFFNKLSFKFSMYLVAIILILMTLFTIYLVNDFAADEADIYQENFKRNLELLANTSSNYLWDFEFKDLKENAEYFFQEEELVQIIIKDGKGEKLVELRSPAIKKGKLLKASQKIYYSNDKFLGEVEITYTDYFYKIRVAVLRNRLIMLSLILTLALIIVITLVSKKAFKPLNNLIKVIKNINKTNFDNKIKEYSNDEIGLLAMNFNYMIEEINASYQQLEAYNEEITALNEELSYQAFHDPLTEIPNRRRFINILEKELKSDAKGALSLLDINDFKEINDNYGHIYGDRLLTEVAQRLAAFSSENIAVARYGGDEFLILIKNLNINQIEKEVTKLKAVFNQPFAIKDDQIFIKFALGIALYPEDAKTTDQLITKADIAMYEAKKIKKNNYLYYNQKMIDQLKRRKKIKNKLQNALKIMVLV